MPGVGAYGSPDARSVSASKEQLGEQPRRESSARKFEKAEGGCEMPGSASNSARIPITGDPVPKLAMKAVGIPAISLAPLRRHGQNGDSIRPILPLR
jgi:hypothetical protein